VLEISVLGPVEVRRDGRPVTVPAGKASELLAHLALEAGSVVRAERLLDDLWAGAATRRNTLQSKVAMLRRALGDPALVPGADGGYALRVEPAAVDALRVVEDAAAAAERLEAGDAAGAAELSAAGLARYRGEPLGAAGDWAAPHRARLEETRTTLLETRFAARLRLGDDDVIGDLEAAVAAHPYQERLWELLIGALYAAGRQADALAAYRRVQTRLSDDLGLEPGPRLRELERRVLDHDPALRVAERPAATGNLPSLSAGLVGRDADIATLTRLLAEHRLVDVVGPGGIGKTAVAVATGRALAEVRGGAWLVRLETAQTADDVLDTVIAALHVTGGEPALVERLRRAETLLILDNCEHVLDPAATLAERLLDAAPALRVLATSQVALDVDGEAVVELAPLALDDAVELFARRAARPGDAAEVHDLCRSLDGLPLAIELAAARTRTLSVAEIARRLDDRFGLLSDPTSRKPERRRALKATIGWSYELLFPDDKRGLWALSAFTGGASLAAVESVLAALDVPPSAAIDVVGRLASRSLVIVDAAGAEAPRYRLLDSIRAFAGEAMTDAGLTDRALDAHAAWYAAAAASSTVGVRSARQAEHLAFARAERTNIDAALQWSGAHDPRRALAIANGFGWAWIVLGDSRGAQRLLAALDAAGDAAPAGERAVALLLAAWVEASTGHLEPARRHVAAARALADALGDADLQARCAYHLAYVVSHHGEWEHALALTAEARALYDGLDRPWDQAANALFASRAAISAGDRVRAAEARDEVQRRLEVVDDPWLHVRRDAMLGELARVEHRFDDAVRHIARAAETSERLGFLQTEAYQVSSLGRAQCQAGDYPAGAATLEAAIGKAEATGDVRLAALARVHLGRVLRALGRTADARASLEAAAAWHRDAGGGEQAALGDCLLAALDASDGVPGADERLRAILAAARAHDDAPVEVFALDALARLAAEAGDAATARELGEGADRRMETASHFIAERDRTDARAVSPAA
jgi:predicted ATPase/DNA-binding SARP family transcriptional activator